MTGEKVSIQVYATNDARVPIGMSINCPEASVERIETVLPIKPDRIDDGELMRFRFSHGGEVREILNSLDEAEISYTPSRQTIEDHVESALEQQGFRSRKL